MGSLQLAERMIVARCTRGLDPTPVDAITELKRRMAGAAPTKPEGLTV